MAKEEKIQKPSKDSLWKHKEEAENNKRSPQVYPLYVFEVLLFKITREWENDFIIITEIRQDERWWN